MLLHIQIREFLLLEIDIIFSQPFLELLPFGSQLVICVLQGDILGHLQDLLLLLFTLSREPLVHVEHVAVD